MPPKVSNPEINRFVEYLDNYKNKHVSDKYEFLDILYCINRHYKTYDTPSIFGSVITQRYTRNKPATKKRNPYRKNTNHTLDIGNRAANTNANKSQSTQIYDNSGALVFGSNTDFYNMYSDSLWNTDAAANPPFLIYNPETDKLPMTYDEWIEKHETDVSVSAHFYSQNNIPSPFPLLIAPKPADPVEILPREKIDIQANVHNISDLLHIIETNEYNDKCAYNIDLKSLHNIKSELMQMNSMVGMQSLKTSILDQLLYFIQNLHIGKDFDFKHTVIYGPPGTGKTEIAKIIGTMYSKLGVLKNNVFKKATRNDLVAGYLGQTALKTKKVITECLGGCLFIDEVYSLANQDFNDSYSKECIDTLCESLSDHKDELMVIIAGYEEDVNNTFFKANRGLDSRFIWRFRINDYTHKELMQIFKKKVADNDWKMDCGDPVKLEQWFSRNHSAFKNYGRDMELLFSYTKISHGRRIYGKPDELRKIITLEDLDNGYAILLKNTKTAERAEIYGLYV
jgi:hypothetical protein